MCTHANIYISQKQTSYRIKIHWTFLCMYMYYVIHKNVQHCICRGRLYTSKTIYAKMIHNYLYTLSRISAFPYRLIVSLAVGLSLLLVVATPLKRFLTMSTHEMLQLKDNKFIHHRLRDLWRHLHTSGCHVLAKAWITRLSMGRLWRRETNWLIHAHHLAGNLNSGILNYVQSVYCY